MAVTDVNEDFDRSGSQEQGKTDFSRTFKVLCSDKRDGAAVIFAHPEVPSILSAYITTGDEVWSSALLRSRTAKLLGGNDANGYLWKVDCKYSTKGEGDEQEGQENPILQPTKISIRTNRFQKAYEKDRANRKITNSSGQQFDPVPEFDDSRPSITLSKNVSFFSLAWLEEYKDATNEDPYLGFAKYFWKISDITADRTFWDAPNGQRFYYWEVSLGIEGNDLLWYPSKILDMGRYELDLSNQLVPIRVGADNRPVQDPVPLDGDGSILDPDADPAFMEFDIYKRKSFGALGLL